MRSRFLSTLAIFCNVMSEMLGWSKMRSSTKVEPATSFIARRFEILSF